MQERDTMDTLSQVRLEERLEQFEQSWVVGSKFGPEEFLDGLAGTPRLQTLAELVRVDMELRSEAILAVELDDYLTRFPELRNSEQLLGDIAFEDYRLRCNKALSDDTGLKLETPSPGEYASRFGINTDAWPRLQPGSENSQRSPVSSCSSRASHSRATMPKIGDSFCGFRLIGLLGTGACGKVFLARQEVLANRLVSLKLTTQRSTESTFLARLQHSHIVPVFSVHEGEDCNAICMPFLGLATLKNILNDVWNQRANDRVPVPSRSYQALLSTVNQHRVESVLDTIPNDQERECFQRVVHAATGINSVWDNKDSSWSDVALDLAVKITDGLAHAHGKSVVHGDIKPANILVTDDGEPVLLDFHLSQMAMNDARSGEWIGGTLPYMSPEMMEGYDRNSIRVDIRCDVWSIGVVLFEMFTGQQPWGPVKLSATSTDFSILVAERRQARPIPKLKSASAVNPDLLNIIHKCLAPNSSDRYQNAGQLHDDLLRHQHNRSPNHARSSGPAERFRKFMRRHPKVTSMTSVGVVSLLIIAILGWTLFARSSRLARVEALRDSGDFVEQALHEKLSLSVMSGDMPNLQAAGHNARVAMEKWGAGTPEQLINTARFSLLPIENRQLERLIASNIHFWLAESFRRSALASLDPDARQKQLQQAASENSIARSFFEKNKRSKSLEMQNALLLRDLGRDELAAQQLSTASALKAETADDYLMTAWLMQRDIRSIEIAKKAIELAPLNHTAWIVAGNIFRSRDQLDQASSCYEIAATIAPQEPFSHYFLGRVELDRHEYQKAIQSFDRVLELEPDHCATTLNRGLCLAATGRWHEAEKAYSTAIESGTTNTRVWYLRSGARRQLGNESGATEDFQRFMNTQPEDDISFVTRGSVLVASSPDKAIGDFQQALQINPHSKEALQNLAHVYSEIKQDLPTAIKMLDKLIEIFPNDATQVATRGVLHARAGSRERALQDAERAFTINQDADTRYRVAGIYAQTSKTHPDDVAIAISHVAQALVENPAMVLGYMARDPDVEPLKSTTEWRDLEETAKKLVNTTARKADSPPNQGSDKKNK